MLKYDMRQLDYEVVEDETQWVCPGSPDNMAMVSQEYKKKFRSLSHYIKWIIDNTELQIKKKETPALDSA